MPNQTLAFPISIHAPREGSDRIPVLLHSGLSISIHAPREGSDIAALIGGNDFRVFQSTLPARGATGQLVTSIPKIQISIHAPREGSDKRCARSSYGMHHFNPRSPRGERRTVKACSNDRIKRSTLREPHFLYSKNACFSPIFPLCATTSRTKNQRIIVSFGSYPGLAPMCFTLDWYRFPRL